MDFDWHKRAPGASAPEAAAVKRDAPAGQSSVLRRLLDGLAARRHRRDLERLTAHLAWTSTQREALRARPRRRI
jgi:hypothetical protein